MYFFWLHHLVSVWPWSNYVPHSSVTSFRHYFRPTTVSELGLWSLTAAQVPKTSQLTWLIWVCACVCECVGYSSAWAILGCLWDTHLEKFVFYTKDYINNHASGMFVLSSLKCSCDRSCFPHQMESCEHYPPSLIYFLLSR